MRMVTLYHIVDGPVEFPSALADDALKHPGEWAQTPWPVKKGPIVDPAPKPAADVPPDDLTLRHRGRGSYSIMRGDVEVVEGLTKEEGEAKLSEMLTG